MPLSDNVSAQFRLQYASSVTLVAQMTRNPLAGAVTEISAKGEAQSTTDLFDAGEYTYGEARSRKNPENPVTGSRRWLIQPPVIESGDYIYQEDKFATATDPTSTYVTIHTNRVVRGKFDRMMGIRKENGVYVVADGGILGTATSGKRADVSAPLPNSQFVPAGTTGMTIDKLRLTKLALNQADFGMEDDDPLYCVVTPKQIDDLLAIAQASATPLNAYNIEQLKSGKPGLLMGINWIPTNRVPVKSSDPTVRLCPVFSKKNIMVGVWQDIKGDAWNDTSAKNLPYVYVSAYIDAVRNQDKGVVVIECKE